MTTNAFLFAWDCNGIESIIAITEYENIEKQNLFNRLAGRPLEHNPLGDIINRLILRARFNSHRHYEIYSIDCDRSFTLNQWRDQWADYPQATADLVRKRGIKIYSDRRATADVIV